MNLSEALIKKFLENKCTDAEAEEVASFLEEHPGVLDKYLNQLEWNDIDADENIFQPGAKEKIRKFVYNATIKKSNYSLPLHVKRMLAAACFLLVFVGVWLLFKGGNSKPGDIAVNKTIINEAPLDSTITNTSDKDKKVFLPDSSVVVLSARSEIRFSKIFSGKTRDVYLKGQSFFKETENKLKPFIVYSKGISTTAIGTSFTVTAFEKDSMVKVALHTGKVLVQSATPATGAVKSVYLLPGQLLVMNTQTWATVVERTDVPVKGILKKSVTDTYIAAKTVFKENTDDIVFEQVPLNVVFDKLAKQYNVVIVKQSPKALDGKNFTGVVHKKDAVDNVLKDIAVLNNLIVTKTESGYSIASGD